VEFSTNWRIRRLMASMNSCRLRLQLSDDALCEEEKKFTQDAFTVTTRRRRRVGIIETFGRR